MSNRYLSTALRRALERTVKDARVVAEEGARDAIRRLGVADGKAPTYLNEPEKELRRRLRAHARALGDAFDRNEETQETKHLVEAAAYAHWHRMLFARFLAERGLLRNPEHDVAITLEDCRELAEAEGLADVWAVAERYAAAMLPAVFRIDDPVLALDLDPVHTQKLHRLVTGLEAEVFQAEDSLGWTYQFWRAAEKDAVNKSGVKIGADELPAVTQLFTEPYMVRFLLHNTLGAWWAGKALAACPALAQTAADEDALRAACSLPGYQFDMLRFVRDGEDVPWRPAAGTFPGWPKKAEAITMLDPCCGSGHFLTEALTILAALRQAEDNLSSGDAVVAVLRDNLHGLEIDGRCVQIAAFAVALTAWRIAGWQTLPLPQIAWVGAPPPLPRREFVALADGDAELEYALAALHDLFAQAPILGSLLEPTGGDLFETEKMREIERLLAPLLAKARRAEPEQIEGVVAARGMADAAALLHRRYTLQATNVPFLGRSKQSKELTSFIERRFDAAKGDLATAMLSRMRSLAEPAATITAVTPQNWLFLGRNKDLRRELMSRLSINIVASLGARAFETISGEVVNVVLFTASGSSDPSASVFSAIEAHDGKDVRDKTKILLNASPTPIRQADTIAGPDSIIRLDKREINSLVGEHAIVRGGTTSGDAPLFRRHFWEIDSFGDHWFLEQTSFSGTRLDNGLSDALLWEGGVGLLGDRTGGGGATVAGREVWGREGIAISYMADLGFARYHGTVFENTICVLCPFHDDDLPAFWAFCESGAFLESVRKVNRKLSIDVRYFEKADFDVEYWRGEARKSYPLGLPQPCSTDPTQWLFHGHPADASRGTTLHIVLARLAGYRWPAESDPDMRLSDEARTWITKAATLPAGDTDGLLGVPAVAGEKPLADRLRTYLTAVFEASWSDALERRLVAEADEILDKKAARDGSLEGWLRDRAFRQHCALFGQRPFLWHISDGLKDGFSAFIHYHRFDQANLRKLTYTMLGDWLARAKAENNALRYEKGRELQQMLEKVLEGEKPYDIFVRWKSPAQLPLGWTPDLDDGVRQNIRPFIMAGVLTHDLSNILKDKDRGTDVSSAPWYSAFKGERRNDHHTSVAEKRAARDAAAKRVEAAQ
ncbi:hypothetical protein ACC764_35805 [Rhizobium ruizarguesonis]